MDRIFGLVAAFLLVVKGQERPFEDVPSALLDAEHRSDNCNCMEYWECINSGGQPISYCGLVESKVCCLLRNTEEDSQFKKKCGIKGFDSGLIGVAEPSEWPWHVAVVEEVGFYYVCGGSLIDENWIMTAAHCVYPYTKSESPKLKIRLGEHDVAGSTEALPHEDRNVSIIVVYPDYNPTTLSSDIALLRVNHPVRQRHHIDVVCLPDRYFDVTPRDSCFLTGWGKTAENGSFSQVLKEVPIPVWKDKDCEVALQKEFGNSFKLPNNTMCAGATGRDACDGDGGGPLVCQQDGQWVQQGIVSYGFGCGQRGVPGVYTRVSVFESWIKQVVLGSR